MNRVLPTLLILLASGSLPAAEPVEHPVLLLPGQPQPVALRLQGRDDVTAWAGFLDALFDHFDRDGDGVLQPTEVSRLFPLPLANGRELTFDFTKLDANRDGKIDREELKIYCQRGGFGPLAITLSPPTEEGLRVGDALFRHLDVNGDSRLSAAELKRAAHLLRTLDEDEDETLTPAELLAGSRPSAFPPTGVVRLAERGARIDAATVLRLPEEKGRPTHLSDPKGRWELVLMHDGSAADVKDTAEFCRAQFLAAADAKAGATRKVLEADLTSAVLVELFDFADRDTDGRLTSTELDAYLKLAELGARCQTLLHLTERGRNLFAVLDADGDGRLSLRELNAAGRLPDGLRPEDVPLRVHGSVRRGVSGASFAGLALTAPPPSREPRTAKTVSGPRWFDAQDRNGDGLLSPREFVGPPDVFRRLDANGDGVIDRTEAGIEMP